jgi:hypothetical protein
VDSNSTKASAEAVSLPARLGPPGRQPRAQTPGGAGRTRWRPVLGVVDVLKARRIVIVAGADWWPDVRARLGFEHLERRSLPILAAGRVRDTTIVATYHPGAHIKGLTRDDFAAQIAAEIRSLEGN